MLFPCANSCSHVRDVIRDYGMGHGNLSDVRMSWHARSLFRKGFQSFAKGPLSRIQDLDFGMSWLSEPKQAVFREGRKSSTEGALLRMQDIDIWMFWNR